MRAEDLHVTLGRTGIVVPKNGFGALPIQRTDRDFAAHLLMKAYSAGIRFFDTARFYTDSESKIGFALHPVRDSIIIATKTMCATKEEFRAQLAQSLRDLNTDYIDLYQFHNPAFCPRPGDGSGLYEEMQEARENGIIRHIGITNHRLAVAREAVLSGLYDTIQFPFSYLSTKEEIDLVRLAEACGVGFIAMKAMGGGLLRRPDVAWAFQAEFRNSLPIWGIQREEELDEFLGYGQSPVEMNEERLAAAKAEQDELGMSFCRGCGYCLPCPAKIDIPNAARMSLMIRRAPESNFLNDDWEEKMNRIDDCISCGHCTGHCPYGLNTPKLLRENLLDYREIQKARRTAE